MDHTENNIIDLLVEECRRGNRKAQFRLYKQYSRAMYNIACRMMNNREDAEDILQETFVDCFRNIGTFRYESTFGAWLKRILINKCINEHRRKKTDLVFFETLPERITEEEHEPVPDTISIARAIDKIGRAHV
jgi:RNA polymerase sigma-70 factor (ECF subfamily)